MKNIKNISLSFLPLLIVGAIVFMTNACVRQSASEADPSQQVAAPNVDANIAAAEKMIKAAPDSTKGYVQLSALYIKRARETGDFSLNTKAETAVKKALEIAPEDIPARKVQASL